MTTTTTTSYPSRGRSLTTEPSAPYRHRSLSTARASTRRKDLIKDVYERMGIAYERNAGGADLTNRKGRSLRKDDSLERRSRSLSHSRLAARWPPLSTGSETSRSFQPNICPTGAKHTKASPSSMTRTRFNEADKKPANLKSAEAINSVRSASLHDQRTSSFKERITNFGGNAKDHTTRNESSSTSSSAIDSIYAAKLVSKNENSSIKPAVFHKKEVYKSLTDRMQEMSYDEKKEDDYDYSTTTTTTTSPFAGRSPAFRGSSVASHAPSTHNTTTMNQLATKQPYPSFHRRPGSIGTNYSNGTTLGRDPDRLTQHQVQLQAVKWAWQVQNQTVARDTVQTLKRTYSQEGNAHLSQSVVEKMIDERMHAMELRMELQLNSFMNQIQEEMEKMQEQYVDMLASAMAAIGK